LCNWFEIIFGKRIAMSNKPEALRLADVLTEEGDSWWDEQAAAELRRLYQLAVDQHTEIYGLRLQVRNLLKTEIEKKSPGG
jgi:hypothetical protein